MAPTAFPPDTSPPADAAHQFINRALGFTLLENTFKPIAPLMELVCAGLFAGGRWGRYKFYESLVYLLFRVSLLGMDKGIIWYYSQVEEPLYVQAFFRSLTWCLLGSLGLGLFAWANYAGWLPFADWVLGKNFASFDISGGDFLLYLSAVPMMVIAELCIQANVNKQNLKYRIVVPGIVVPLVVFTLAILGHFVAPTLLRLPRCFVAGYAAGAAVALVGFFRVHRPRWRDLSWSTPPRRMVRYSIPLAGANIFSALAVRADIFMLAGFTNVHSVEIYAVVSMIGKSLTSIRQSFENILLSAFSTSATSAAGRLTLKVKHYFNYSNWLVTSIQGAALALLVLFGVEGLRAINAQYAAGYWTLVLTAFFVYANTWCDFVGILALGLGRTTVFPLVQVLFFVANVGLNYVLIPRWDTAGAAVALGLANAVSGLAYLIYLMGYYRTGLFLREYWLAIIAEGLWLGLIAGGAIRLHAPWGLRVACLLGFLPVLWVQRNWYRRFNRRMQAL